MDFRAIIQRNAYLHTVMALAFMRAANVVPDDERKQPEDTSDDTEDPELRACRKQRYGVQL